MPPPGSDRELVLVDDDQHVRTLTFNRPEARNAFNEAMYDAATDALAEAEEDAGVAVVVLTGAGAAFCAGQDLHEMASRMTGGFTPGRHGFVGFVDQLAAFGKPLLCAVNGAGLGLGATMLGFADLVFMASDARLKCPFTSLGVAPEAASSVTFPRLAGRQHATWALMSSEWIPAAECLAMGLVWKVCPPDELLTTAHAHARVLAEKPLSSLVETKRTIVEGLRADVDAARARENEAFSRLLGATANRQALTAFADRQDPPHPD